MKSYHRNQILLTERLCLSQVINIIAQVRNKETSTQFSLYVHMERKRGVSGGKGGGQKGRVMMASEGQSLRGLRVQGCKSLGNITAPSLLLIPTLI